MKLFSLRTCLCTYIDLLIHLLGRPLYRDRFIILYMKKIVLSFLALVVALGGFLFAPSVSAQTKADQKSPSWEERTFRMPIQYLGVQLQLPMKLRGIRYWVTYDRKAKVWTATFSSNSLMNLELAQTGVNHCTVRGGAIGRIIKGTKLYQEDGSPREGSDTVLGENDKQIGKYYYTFRSAQEGCSSDKIVNDLQTEQINMLREAFRNSIK